MKEIKFQDNEYWLMGEKDGAIATPQQYLHGMPSYAHLTVDGTIMRYGRKIGTIKDIYFIGEIPKEEITIDPDAWENLFNPNFWGLS